MDTQLPYNKYRWFHKMGRARSTLLDRLLAGRELALEEDLTFEGSPCFEGPSLPPLDRSDQTQEKPVALQGTPAYFVEIG